MPTWSSSSTARVPRGAAAHAELDAQRLGDLLADREDGVQAARRVLEDHRDLAPADRAQLGGRRAGAGRGRPRAPRRRPRGRAPGTRPSSEQQRHALARARLADEPLRLARAEREAHAGGGEHRARARRRTRCGGSRTSSSGAAPRSAARAVTRPSSATARIIPSFSPARPRRPRPRRSARPSPIEAEADAGEHDHDARAASRSTTR